MLGLGSSLLQGGALRSIVKSGLQLFYKADKTQAPLGEEQVRNNSFDEISGNLVSNPTFDLGSEAIQNGTFNLGTDEVVDGGFPTGTTAWTKLIPSGQVVEFVNNQLHINYDASGTQQSTGVRQSILTPGKTYEISIDIQSTTGTLTVLAGGVSNNFDTIGVKTFTVTPTTNALFIINPLGGGIYNDMECYINSISVKEVTNWVLDANWSVANNTAIYVGDGNANELLQEISFIGGRTYEIKIDVASISGSLKARFNNQHANKAVFNQTGMQTLYITATGSGNITDDLSISRETGVASAVLNSVSVKEVPNWELQSNWSVSENQVVSNGSNGWIKQKNVVDNGESYQVVFSAEVSSGRFRAVTTGDVSTYTPYITESGTYTFYASPTNSLAGGFEFVSDAFDGSITNVSVKQLDPNNRWALGDGWDVTNNRLNVDTDDGGGVTISSIGLKIGKPYVLTLDASLDVGEIKFESGEGDNFIITSSDTTTSHTFVADDARILLRRNLIPTRGYIDNISIKEITNSIKDHSKNSNDGILYSGKALNFDGDGDGVQLNTAHDISILGDYTIAFWFKRNNTSDSLSTIYHNSKNGDNRTGVHWTADNKITFNSYSTATNYTGINSPVLDKDKWYRVISVAKGGVKTLYINNENNPTSSGSISSYLPTPNEFLGGSAGGTDCDGAVADFQLYDKAWNATDVKYDWENPDKDVFDRVGVAEVLGSEEVFNGEFATDLSSWDISGADATHTVTYSNGSARYESNSVSPQLNFDQTISNVEVGKTYQLSIDVTYTTGSLKVSSIDPNITALSEGLNVFNVVAATKTIRILRGANIVDALINSVSVKEVTTHASHILPTDCKSLLRLNEGAGDRVYDAAPVLGAEKVVDGNFPSGITAWEEGGDTTIGNNEASFDGTGSYVYQDILEVGKLYECSVRVKTWVSGPYLSVGTATGGGTSSNIGYHEITKLDNTTTTFTFTAEDSVIGIGSRSFDIDGSIDFVSIKEIKPAESFAIVGTKAFIHQQPHIPQYAMSSFSKKMFFDGVNDYVTGSFNGNIGPAKDITFSCWFSYEDSVTGPGDRQTLFGLMSSSGDGLPFNKLDVSIFETNKITVFTGNGTNYSTSNSTQNSLVKNKLNHVAVSVNDYDASNGVIKIYINGVLDTTTTMPYYGAPTISHYRIGSRSNSTQLSKGIIDEVSLFKSELTQDEVLELYNSGSSFDSTGHSKYNLGEEVSNGTFELGSELSVNGDFINTLSPNTVEGASGASNITWDSQAGGSAKLIYNSNDNTGLFLKIPAIIENGKNYYISIDATTITNGSKFKILGNDDQEIKVNIGNGTTNFSFVATHSVDNIRIYRQDASQNSQLYINSFTIKEIPNWSFGDGWSYVDDKASLVQVGDPQATDYLKQELTGLVDGRTYVVGFDLDISTNGQYIGMSAGGAFGNLSASVRFYTTSGRKTFTAVYDSSHQSGIKELRFGGGAGVAYTIDNVSVQEYGVSGYWRNNGADQWNDLSINSNHGTVSGSPTEIFLQEVPFFGKDSLGMFMNKPRLGGLNFNTSGYVNIEDNNDLDFGTDDFTIECWVVAKYEYVGSSINVILGLGGNVSQTGSAGLVSFDSNKLGGYVDGATLSANDTFTEGSWYHVVITRTSGTCKLYIDSVLQSDQETSGGSISNSDAKQIGKDTTTSRGYDGVVDDVKLYNRDLTPAEIKKNYNATKGKHKN